MPAEAVRTLEVVDTHYGGDVSRIVLGGVGPLPGATVFEQMRFLEREADGLRRLLLHPPHGDPRMCVDLVVAPSDPEAQAGYIIMEAMGYPPFSGSNTVCMVTALLESGRIRAREGPQEVRLEAPAGLVRAEAEVRDGRVVCVTVEGGPAYVAERGLTARVPGHGEVTFDLVWSGCFYAVIDAGAVGIAVTGSRVADLLALARSFVEAARETELPLVHPELGAIGPLSVVCFAGPVERTGEGRFRTPSATYVHPDVLCSCPTGTGTSARIALLRSEGRITEGEVLDTVSPNGSTIRGTVLADAHVGGLPAVRSTIAGRAFTLARSQIVIDSADPMVADHGLGAIPSSGGAG